MIVQVPGRGVFGRPDMPFGIDPAQAETSVGVLPVRLKIEAMLQQNRAGKSIVAHAIATHPGVDQRKRKQKENRENLFVFVHSEQSYRLSLTSI